MDLARKQERASYHGVHRLPGDWWYLGDVPVYTELPVLPRSLCGHLWRHILGKRSRVVVLPLPPLQTLLTSLPPSTFRLIQIPSGLEHLEMNSSNSSHLPSLIEPMILCWWGCPLANKTVSSILDLSPVDRNNSGITTEHVRGTICGSSDWSSIGCKESKHFTSCTESGSHLSVFQFNKSFLILISIQIWELLY